MASIRAWPTHFELKRWCEPGDRRRFADASSAMAFLSCHLHDPAVMTALRRAYAASVCAGDVSRCSDHELICQVSRQIVGGMLKVVDVWTARSPAASPGGSTPPKPAPPAPAPPATDRSQWIHVKIADQDGKPVAGVRYVITAPDNTPHNGVTDGAGLAKLRDLPPGLCRVHFPDLEEKSVQLT